MFVHISPETDAIGETISTLKFAERVSTVELGAARANKDSANVKELKEQVIVPHALVVPHTIIFLLHKEDLGPIEALQEKNRKRDGYIILLVSRISIIR